MNYADLFHHLNSHPDFKDYLDEVEGRCPDIPSYNPIDSNIELMKVRSAQREGFLLALSYFRGTTP